MKTGLKVLFYLKRNETKPDGTCPVMGRITIGNTMEQFSAKCRVQASLWDTKSGRAKGKSNQAAVVNAALNAISVAIEARYKDAVERKGGATALQVKQAFQGIASVQATLVGYFEEHNDKLLRRVGTDRSEGTWKMAIYALNKLRVFMRTKYNLSDIPFSGLTRSFIDDYEHYLRTTLKRKQGTIQELTRYIRRFTREAVSDGVIVRDPFEGYTLELPVAAPRYLPKAELEKLMAAQLVNPSHILTRDMFLMACFTGLSYSDLHKLSPGELVRENDGCLWIRSKRKKTGTPFNVPLLELPLAILEKYRDLAPEGHLLPVPGNGTLDINLKKIAAICGIDTHLSFHVGRHTYATEITLAHGVSIESVSSMLGHRSLRTTQIYARVTNEKIEADMKSLDEKIGMRYKMA